MTLDRPEWGLTDWNGEWLFFVHGTTLETFDVNDGVQDLGAGDFGPGFYAYLASGRFASWGVDKAIEWAYRKAATVQESPCLVYVKMPCQVFQTLLQLSCDKQDCRDIYDLYDPYQYTGYELVSGPVARRETGHKVPNDSLPFQFKFEGTGIAKLIIDCLFCIE